MIGNPLLLPDEGYNISRSVRLRSGASGNFSRTPASAGNRRTWTWSGWVKRGAFNIYAVLFSAGNNNTTLMFNKDQNESLDYVEYDGSNILARAVTAPIFRDPSAWYHVVWVIDTTQSTSSNRIKCYVNGAQVSFSTTTYMSQNYDTYWNSAIAHYVSREAANNRYFEGYLTEINFIDGQALTPSSFGETDVLTGVWKPKKYTGTYGTNGFYLNFSDNSSNTATTIGKDYSGNGNNWTPNNISVTSGATYDSMLDVPTLWADGGNGRGNYATLNPIFNPNGTVVTYSAANLQYSYSTPTGVANKATVQGSFALSSGKWYFEFTEGSPSNAQVGIGSGVLFGGNANGANYVLYYSGSWNASSATTPAAPASFTNGDVIGVAFDVDNRTAQFFKNGVSQGTITAFESGLSWYPVVSVVTSGSGGAGTLNFGQRPFAYTPPTGFKALNTQNLPEPTIKKGNQWFDATTYTGTGATQSITNSGSMQPDLVWLKTRSTISSNLLYDAQRGALNYLSSNQTAAEASLANSLTAFNSNGFALGSDGNVNGSGTTFVGWQWKEGATPGFDIVTFTAPSSNQSFTVAHSLGVAPKMIIMKRRDSSTGGDWWTWHIGLGDNTTDYLALNQTAAEVTAANMWGTLGRSSTAFGANVPTSCIANGTYVAYLFADVAGFSKFGSYTGNGSTDGPFIFTGFRPAFVMCKRTDGVSNWNMADNRRPAYNAADEMLLANSSSSALTSYPVDLLSNGFKLRTTEGGYNASGSYIYAAFAETAFKFSLSR